MRSFAPSAANRLGSSQLLRLVSVAFLLAAPMAPCVSVAQGSGGAFVEYRVVDMPLEHLSHSAWRLSADGSVLWEAVLSDGDGGFWKCLFHEHPCQVPRS